MFAGVTSNIFSEPQREVTVGYAGGEYDRTENTPEEAMYRAWRYIRNAFCGSVDLVDVVLTRDLLDQLVEMEGHFRIDTLNFRPVRFVDVSRILASGMRLLTNNCRLHPPTSSDLCAILAEVCSDSSVLHSTPCRRIFRLHYWQLWRPSVSGTLCLWHGTNESRSTFPMRPFYSSVSPNTQRMLRATFSFAQFVFHQQCSPNFLR